MERNEKTKVLDRSICFPFENPDAFGPRKPAFQSTHKRWVECLLGLQSLMALLFVIGRMRQKVLMGGLCLMSGVRNLAGVFMWLKRWKTRMELTSFFWANGFQRAAGVCVGVNPDVREKLGRVGCEGGHILGWVSWACGSGGGARQGEPVFLVPIFGVTILVCELCVVWLPETKGIELFDIMEEEEEDDYRGNEVDLNNL
ncbi:organic cation/carnitine transporter 2 [Striga asiatica]|uniref:Organic cation/carnitine transporter 2 n=1 Tax=Striga asiatica TaxID=4170 RepID=A0A5A7PHB5_STRAF|nr:organic cation/carnitine transporter 2 [Striga asiatica]